MLPNFKESVATHLISKQHEDPYKLVGDVTLEDVKEESLVNFMSFVYGSLSDDDQILQRLHLKLVRNYSASDINFWVQVAVSRSVRKLRIDLYGGNLVLPSCLSSCTTLKSLILRDLRIEVGPLVFSLPSLKSLHLFSVDFLHTESIASLLQGCPDLEYLVLNQTSYDYWKFRDVRVCLSSLKSLHLLSAKHHYGGSLTRLLQSCQVLEYLVVNQTDNFWNYWDIPPASCLSSIKILHLSSARVWNDESIATLLKSCVALEDLVISRTRHDNVRLYNISVPTLKSLTINNSIVKRVVDDKENHGFWINAPALETLNIKDTASNFIMLEFMPKVTKANIQVTCAQPERFIGSLTSIQHLSLCCPTSDARKLRWPSNVKNVSSMFGCYKYILHLLTPYRIGSVFPYLEHLELCTCSSGWVNLLAFILNDAPRLQSLKLKSVCST